MVGAGQEAAAVEVEAPEPAVVVEPAEGAGLAAAVEPGRAREAVVRAAAEALRQWGQEAYPGTRGLPQTPRRASAWLPRDRSPSAPRRLCLSSG